MRPSVGRVVHYTSYGTPGGEFKRECRAAIITEITPADAVPGTAYDVVDPLRVGLAVLNPTGIFLHSLAAGGCKYEHPDNGPGGEARGGTWHWPERVE